MLPFVEEKETVVFFGVYGLLQHWTKKSSYTYLSTPRPNHGLMYILCDHVLFEYADGTADVFDKGNLIYIPQGLFYKVTFQNQQERFHTLLVNFSLTGPTQPGHRVTKLVTDASPKYTDSFHTIISLYKQSKNKQYGIMAAFYELLDALDSHMERKSITSYSLKLVHPAMDYIDAHIGESLSVKYLAELCLLSESCFRKHFKDCTGATPAAYIADMKLKKAKHTLETTDIPISAIAADLGFYDTAYFYKTFCKKYGATPAQHRQTHQICV